jgi:hypothetical protein
MSTITPLFAQAPETLLWLLEENRIDEIKQKLPEVSRAYPNSPTVLYLQGVLESDGEKALGYYQKILKDHPTSTFADDALLRLAQCDFARGLYIAADKKVRQLPKQYPDSPLCDDAHYMRIQCLKARGEVDSMAYALEWFLTNYPDSPFSKIAVVEINGREGQWVNEREYEPIQDKDEIIYHYSIQIGAFKSIRNAERLKQAIQEDGHEVEIRRSERNGEMLYLVWVGKFRRESQALEFGQEFRKDYGLPFRVVNRDKK